MLAGPGWGDDTATASGSVAGSGTSYTVSGSHTYAESGLYNVLVTTTDAGGASVTFRLTASVSSSFLSALVVDPTLTEGIAGSPVTVATFGDSDANTFPSAYAATVTWGDGSSSPGIVSGGSGGFSVAASHTYTEEGQFSASVSVGDQDGASAIGQGTVTVADAALSGTGTPVQASAATPFEGAVGTFSDADPGAVEGDFNAVITWGDNTTPTDGTVAVAGSRFQVNGGHTYATAGSYSLSISLTDQGGATTTFPSTATVSPPPQTLTPPTVNAIEGQPFSGTVSLFTPANSALPGTTYEVEIGWGDGGVSGGGLTPNGAGSFWVSGSHTYAEETAVGYPYALTVTVTGPGAAAAGGSGSATVNDAALGATAGPALTAFTNSPTGSVLLGRFRDANPGAPVTDFSATVDFGDGSATATGFVAVDAQGGFDVFGGHTYTTAGSYTVQVVISDDGGQSVTLSGTATVTTLTAQLSATEGTSFNGVVATFPGDPSKASGATLVWGDGSSASATITATGSSGFTVSGNHTYSEEETYDLGVSVALAGGGGLSASGPATVADATLSVVSGPTLTAVAGTPLGATGPVRLAHFADAYAGAPLSDYSASIQWGDGDTENAAAQADPQGGIDVFGNHVYGDAGGYALTITLYDVGGSQATAYGAVTVDQAEGQSYSASLLIHPAQGTQLSWGTQYTAQIAWGDGTSSPAVAELASDLVDLEVTGDHVYQEEGSYTITATAFDPAGLGGSATSGVVIGDAVLKSAKEAFTVVAGTPYDGPVGGFSDANLYATPSDFTVTGSGSTVTGGDGGFAVNGSFTFATPGTYPLSTSVADDGGAGVVVNSTVTVVPPWTVPVDSSGGGDTRSNDPQAAFLKGIGEATVDLNQGGVRLSQALDFDQSPGTAVGGAPALVYNSDTVSVRPVIQLGIGTNATLPPPTSAEVVLTWNGVAQSAVTLPVSGVAAGQALLLAVQVDSPVAQTGRYNWSALVTLTFPDASTQQVSASGSASVVVRDSSPYGAGWGLDGVAQLVAVSGGVLWVTGSGDSRYFAANGDGTFTGPAEDFGTLVQNGDGSYTYTAKDQTQISFNAAGDQSSVVDTHGLTLSYAYDSQNRLIGVQAPDGGVTVLAYDPGSGLLSSITEPGNRVVQVGHDGSGNLWGLIDAAGFGRTLGYDIEHHVTSDQWSPLSATFSYDTGSGLLTQVNQGLGSVWTVNAAAAQGLTAAVAGSAWAALTDGNTHTTQFLLDERGRLLEQVQADGATDSYSRDAAGQVTLALDALGHPTSYTYAYGAYDPTAGGGDGDLVQVSYADGSFDSYRYDPTFHHVIQTSNALNETTSNLYDSRTGDLLSSTDARGQTSINTWVAGLLVSSTDPRGITTANWYDAARRLAVSFDGKGVPTYTQYDTSGNVSASIDALGRKTKTAFNGDNELVATLDANGGLTSQTYAADGAVTSDTNARGFTEATSFDQRGFVTQTTDYAGVTTALDQYDAAGNLIQQTDARGDSTTFAYDADNRQTGTTDALNATTTTAYDKAGDVLSTTDALQRTTSYTLDVLNRVAVTTDALGRSSAVLRDLAGNEVVSIDPRGFSAFTFFDANNEATASVDVRGGLTQTQFDADGNAIATIDPQGLKSTTVFDADNQAILSTDPTGAMSRTVFDVLGEAVQSIDARGKVTKFSYDNLGQQNATLDPTGDLTQMISDAAGNTIETIDGRGYATFSAFDADNRTVKQVDADGHTTLTQFDAVGNAVAQTDANGKTTYSFFDADNRAFLTLDPDGHTQQMVMNANGETVASIDGAGDVTQTGFDKDGEATVTQDANGKLTLSNFNADGQQTALIDADGNPTQFVLDAAGNPVATIDPLNNVTGQVFDKDGRVVSQTDALGRTKTFAYDNDGRVLTQTWYNANRTVADVLSFTYDGAGNVLTATNHYGTYRFTYDDSGRVQTQTDPFGLTLTYGYDHDGNVVSVTDSLGGQVISVYDPAGQLVSRQYSGPNNQQARIDLAYTPGGQVATMTRYSDLAGHNRVGLTLYGYDAAGNVTQIQHQDGNGNVLLSYIYTYDTANRLSSQTVNGVTTPYSYDKDSQLISAGLSSNTFDGTGNRTTPGYVTGPDNRLLSDGTWDYQYDANGNIASKVNIQTGETWVFAYDVNNKLTSAVHRDAAGNLIASVTQSYDVLSNLVEQDVYTASTNQTVVTRFAWDDQGNVWADLNGSNHLVMRRLFLDGPNQPFARIDASGNVSWYLADHLGSVVGITNASDGLIDQKGYDAWGNFSDTQPANGDRYGFTGMQWDAVLLVYRDNARNYDPLTGRFTGPDPDSFGAGDTNLGRYVDNDPTNAFDPSGRVVILIHGIYSEAVPWDQEVAKGLKAAWKKGKFEDQNIYRFVWKAQNWSKTKLTKPGVFNATNTVLGTNDKAILAAAQDLKKFVGELRKVLDANVKDGGREPIHVVAHSLGTIVALRALSEGAEINNVVTLGSPLAFEKAAKEIPQIVKNRKAKGQIHNVVNHNDAVVFPVGGGQKWKGDLPDSVKQEDIGTGFRPTFKKAHESYHTTDAANKVYGGSVASVYQSQKNQQLQQALKEFVGEKGRAISETTSVHRVE